MKSLLCSLLIITSITLAAQQKPAYTIFTGEGKKSGYRNMVKEAVKADVVFFGELHDNPIAHWLELELTKDLFAAKGRELIVAAEMFETDNQLLIDEYFSGLIRESSFESEARLWNNYKTDYKPLLNFALENGLVFVASNIPRRYASMVASGGFEALEGLSPEALEFVAPLPVEYDPELPCYKDMLTMGPAIGGPMAKNINENLPKAQAIKDATMAHSIVKYYQPSGSIIHYNGSYHSDRYMGIIWYLNRYRPGLKLSTIATVLQDDVSRMNEEHMGKADFVIVVPSSMTRTY
jgi:uncharacterized iron-regulated protein